MAELMYGEITGAAKASQAIVRQGTGPHEFTHGVVILLVFDGGPAFVYYRAQERFGDSIGQFIVNRIEIPVQGMHHDIGYSAGHLIDGKRISQFRVHDGESGTVQVRTEPSLASGSSIGEDRRIAGLTAGGRNGQDGSDWQGPDGDFSAAQEKKGPIGKKAALW